MAKQRQIEMDNDLDMDLNNDFEEEGDRSRAGERCLGQRHCRKPTPQPVVLSPEAALEHLLTLGRSQGYVSYDDVLQVLPEAENNMEQLEDTFATLFEHGIEVGQARDEEPVGTVRKRSRGGRGRLVRPEPNRDRRFHQSLSEGNRPCAAAHGGGGSLAGEADGEGPRLAQVP